MKTTDKNLKPGDLINSLIGEADTTPILDRHGRVMDVIIVREVIDWLDEEDPLLAEIVRDFQKVGRNLNLYIMGKLREEAGI